MSDVEYLRVDNVYSLYQEVVEGADIEALKACAWAKLQEKGCKAHKHEQRYEIGMCATVLISTGYTGEIVEKPDRMIRIKDNLLPAPERIR